MRRLVVSELLMREVILLLRDGCGTDDLTRLGRSLRAEVADFLLALAEEPEAVVVVPMAPSAPKPGMVAVPVVTKDWPASDIAFPMTEPETAPQDDLQAEVTSSADVRASQDGPASPLVARPKDGQGGVCEGLGAQIKEARLAAGLTQRDAAQIVGISQGPLSQFELGARQAMSRETAERLLVALKVAAKKDPADHFREPARKVIVPVEEPVKDSEIVCPPRTLGKNAFKDDDLAPDLSWKELLKWTTDVSRADVMKVLSSLVVAPGNYRLAASSASDSVDPRVARLIDERYGELKDGLRSSDGAKASEAAQSIPLFTTFKKEVISA